MADRDEKEIYRDLYEKYRVQDSIANQKPLTEQEKKRVLEDAHRKSSKDGFFDHCGADCAEECCECICEAGCEHICS